MTNLVLVRGIPGTGKSTYAQKLIEDGYQHFEADMYFMKDGKYRFDPKKLGAAHGWCYTNTQYHLMTGNNVVVTNTFTTWKEIRDYIELGFATKSFASIISLTKEYGNIHGVPEDKLEQMRKRFLSHKEITQKAAEYLDELHRSC